MGVSEVISFWKEVILHPKEFFEKADLDASPLDTLKNVILWTFAIVFGIPILILMIFFLGYLAMDQIGKLTNRWDSYLAGTLVTVRGSAIFFLQAALVVTVAIPLLILINAGALFILSKLFKADIKFTRLVNALAYCIPFATMLICGVVATAYSFLYSIIRINDAGTIFTAIFGLAALGLTIYSFNAIKQAIKQAMQADDPKTKKVFLTWFALNATAIILVSIATFIVFALVMIASGAVQGPGG